MVGKGVLVCCRTSLRKWSILSHFSDKERRTDSPPDQAVSSSIVVGEKGENLVKFMHIQQADLPQRLLSERAVTGDGLGLVSTTGLDTVFSVDFVSPFRRAGVESCELFAVTVPLNFC